MAKPQRHERLGAEGKLQVFAIVVTVTLVIALAGVAALALREIVAGRALVFLGLGLALGR